MVATPEPNAWPLRDRQAVEGARPQRCVQSLSHQPFTDDGRVDEVMAEAMSIENRVGLADPVLLTDDPECQNCENIVLRNCGRNVAESTGEVRLES